MTEHECPPLPAASVDMNALHAAARKKHDLAKALEGATAESDEQPEETAPPPAGEPNRAAVEPAADETRPADKRGK